MKKASEKRVQELELKNKALQADVEELRNNLANVSVAPGDGVRKIKDNYLRKLNDLEDQVGELKKKLEAQSQQLIQKQKHVEAAKELHYEIQKLKAQKVQLQWNLKKQSVQFRLCKAGLDKEILQLKKEGRRNECKMQKLLALNQGQMMVLQRKRQEASMATKWLRELLESRKSWSHKKSTARDANARIQAVLEHEHELSVRLQELYSDYEHQIEVRAGIAAEIVNLNEEAELMKHERLRCLLEEEAEDCREKDSEIKNLNKMVHELSGLVRQLEKGKAESIHRKKSQSATSISDTVTNNDFQDMVVTELRCSSQKAAENDGLDSRKQATTERSSETGSRSGSGSYLLNSNDSEGLKTGTPVGQHGDSTGKAGSRGCCSCSKKSLCKTLKCKCRANNGSCGTSCGCIAAKCTNRTTDLFKKLDNLQMSEGTGSSQRASTEKPAESDGNNSVRGKALSDVGNTLIKPEAMRPNQSVPGALPPLEQENTRDPKKPEINPIDTDLHSKIFRLAESNCYNPAEYVQKKAAHLVTTRSKKLAISD